MSTDWWSTTDFASRSAASLPAMLQCPGIQLSVILSLDLWADMMHFARVLVTGLLCIVVEDSAVTALRESVYMTEARSFFF